MDDNVKEVFAKIHAMTLEPLPQRSDALELSQLRRDKLLAIRELVEGLENDE